MASHRRPKQPNRARVTVLTATAAAAVALTSQAANAAPKPPTKSEVKEKVDKLNEDAERATDKLNGAKVEQDTLAKEVAAMQDKVARGQDELNTMRDALGSMASAQYRTGGIDPSIMLFLSSDPDSYLDQASTMDQVSAKQADALKEIQAKQRTLAQERQEATGKLKDLSAARKELDAKKKDAQKKLNAAQKLLLSLTAKERAALAAEDAQRASRASDRVSLDGEAPAASSHAAAALAAAKTQIGKPYVSGAEGPNAYDCSGLTQWAYGQAGVTLTRTTYTQVNDGQRIGRSQLRAGDLVFFSNLGHVALFVGGNTILHAPHPGASVRYESMEYAGSFMYGVRIA